MENLKPLRILSKEIFTGAPLYSVSKLSANSEGVVVINIKDIENGELIVGRCQRVNIKDFKNAYRYMVYPKDIIVTCRGTQLKIAVVPQGIKEALITSNLIAIRLGEEILPEFLVAYLNIKEGQRRFFSSASSSRMQLVLNISEVSEFEVPVPPMPLQKEIAELTRSLSEQYKMNMEAVDLRKKITDQVIEESLRR